MPESYPNNEPFLPKAAEGEYEANFEIVEFVNMLHDYYDGALEIDEQIRNAVVNLKHPQSERFEPGYYIQHEIEQSAGPADTQSLLFIPKATSNVSNGFVKQFYLRFTNLEPRFHGENDEDAVTIRANDVLLEVDLSNGNRYRYLINYNGITPYADAEMLDFDDTELKENGYRRPNIYSVNSPEYWGTPALQLNHIAEMLRASTPTPQAGQSDA